MAAIRITMTSSVIIRLRLPLFAGCGAAAGCWGVLMGGGLRNLSVFVVYPVDGPPRGRPLPVQFDARATVAVVGPLLVVLLLLFVVEDAGASVGTTRPLAVASKPPPSALMSAICMSRRLIF